MSDKQNQNLEVKLSVMTREIKALLRATVAISESAVRSLSVKLLSLSVSNLTSDSEQK